MAYIRSDRVGTVEISKLNELVKSDPAGLVSRAEARYDSLLYDIAEDISENIKAHKIIMLSGASNAGKTTSCLKLEEALRGFDVKSHTITLDNFFLPRELCPLDENGKSDIESPRALDAELLASCVRSLIAGEETELPKYDFKTGQSIHAHKTLTIGEHDIVMIEGIHALNDTLVSGLPQDRLCRIYLALRTNYQGEGYLLKKREMRLIRRLVRDNMFRGATPVMTFGFWDGVCKGEEKYIKPFAKHADIILDSSFEYEPALMKKHVLPLLLEIPPESEFYGAACELRLKLLPICDLADSFLPESSLIREFIGGSRFYGKQK